MSFLDFVFDFLDGIFLGIRCVTPLIISFMAGHYITHVMAKDKEVKEYQQFIAMIPIIAVWVLADPGSVHEKVSELSVFGIVPAFAVGIVSLLTIIQLGTRRESPSEEEARKLKQENESLSRSEQHYKDMYKQYKRMYDQDHPDES